MTRHTQPLTARSLTKTVADWDDWADELAACADDASLPEDWVELIGDALSGVHRSLEGRADDESVTVAFTRNEAMVLEQGAWLDE